MLLHFVILSFHLEDLHHPDGGLQEARSTIISSLGLREEDVLHMKQSELTKDVLLEVTQPNIVKVSS